MKGNAVRHAAIMLVAGLLAACGVDDDIEPTFGTFNVDLTDASFDEVDQVWVYISGVTLEPQDGVAQTYPLNPPRSINIKELTNGKLETLLEGTTIPASFYAGLKLEVSGKIDGVLDSYVIDKNGRTFELVLQPNGNTAAQSFAMVMNLETGLITEWNLRTGLVGPVDINIGNDVIVPGYRLLPSLRAVNWLNHGTVVGIVDNALISAPTCTSDPVTGSGNVVYIYEGFGVVPDDQDYNEPNPLTTAEVAFNGGVNAQFYSIPYLTPGDYTVAFTCQGRDDQVPDPTNPDDTGDDIIQFTPGINVEVLPPEEVDGESVPQTVEASFTAG